MVRTRKLTMVAVLSALSFCLMLISFPIIPGADFLKVELSIIPILFGLYLFDLQTAYLILLLRTVLKFVLNNHGVNDMIGLPMNVIALGIFLSAFAVMRAPSNRSRMTYVLSSLLGTVGLTLAMVLLNIFVAIPLYSSLANFDIDKFIGINTYLLTMVIPFNIIQGTIFSVVFGISSTFLNPFLKHYAYEK